MRYATEELWSQTCISCSLIQHCVCILLAHTYIAIWYATTHDNKTHVPFASTTHQTMALLLTMHRLIRTKLASYNTCSSVFSINCRGFPKACLRSAVPCYLGAAPCYARAPPRLILRPLCGLTTRLVRVEARGHHYGVSDRDYS